MIYIYITLKYKYIYIYQIYQSSLSPHRKYAQIKSSGGHPNHHFQQLMVSAHASSLIGSKTFRAPFRQGNGEMEIFCHAIDKDVQDSASQIGSFSPGQNKR